VGKQGYNQLVERLVEYRAALEECASTPVKSEAPKEEEE